MPAARVFIDSTTFLYTRDRADPEKTGKIERWLDALTDHGAGVTNLQVLNEVVSVITRKTRRFAGRDPFFEADIAAMFGASPLSPEAAFAARALFLRYHYSWWDSLLLAAALELGCTHFLSEDMQDGQTIAGADRGLTITDPFAHSPDDILPQH